MTDQTPGERRLAHPPSDRYREAEEQRAAAADAPEIRSNAREVVVLFFWDGASDLVQDVDIVQWSDSGPVFNTVSPNKTGVSVDGPDAGAIASTYLPDTAPQGQELASLGAHGVGNTVTRVNYQEGDETLVGGNGLLGHDETSENLSVTWRTNTAPSIGSPGDFGPPALIAGLATEETEIELVFSRAIDTTSASDAGNFRVTQIETPGGRLTSLPLPVHVARRAEDSSRVILTTDRQVATALYEVIPSNLRSENLTEVLITGSRAFFRGFNPGPGLELEVPLRPFAPYLDGGIEIRYTAPQGDPILLRVFDGQGRELFVMADEVAPEGGVRTLRWDGRNDLAAAVTAGPLLSPSRIEEERRRNRRAARRRRRQRRRAALSPRAATWGLAFVSFACASAIAAAAPRPIPDAPLGTRRGITPISLINANNASGQSDFEFTIVTIEGVIQQPAGELDPFDRLSPSSFFTVSDGTGALAIANPGVLPLPIPAAGTRVRISSVVFTQGAAPLRGTRTLDFEVFGFGTITNLGGGSLDAPVSISAAQLQSLGSSFEGSRVRLEGLTLVDPSEWPASGNSGFVRATDGSGTINVFIDDDTNLDGASPPASAFSLVGLALQDAMNFAAEGEHYIAPGSLADLVSGDGSGLLAVVPTSVPRSSSGTFARVHADRAGGLARHAGDRCGVRMDVGNAGRPDEFGHGFRERHGVLRGQRWNDDDHRRERRSLRDGFGNAHRRLAALSGHARSVDVYLAHRDFGGTPAPITASPTVVVLASAGDVVVNEVCPTLTFTVSGREEAEFIEMRNRTSVALDVTGWTLSDIGRDETCQQDSPWAFPAGATIPANGFTVVCRTAFDPQGPDPSDDRGFLVEFPGFAATGATLYEMFDATISGANDVDHPGTPNMNLTEPTGGADEIALLGGSVTNGGQCESPAVPGRFLPFQELVRLRDVLGTLVDVFEYREIGPCASDLCSTGPTGPNDAYPFGAPAARNTIGRDAASTDTGSGQSDFLASSQPTPGAANLPGDTSPPTIVPPTAALSSGVVEVTFDEPVVDETALDPASYQFVRANGDTIRARDVLADPEFPNRHYYVGADPLPRGRDGDARRLGRA